ncbi:MAG: bifunctional nuclease family protein [Bacteroides sp.]|nr:bifunctional nuclease family protein [Bacteroides sp.]MCM1379358.1 bifunctional nuclease family protein [Bacteroides sp.]MCM1445218.1 bifunctional nuclease family protein [Prevotella sp.]
MEQKRIRLRVLGMSTGEISRGAYALILAQVDGPVRIPVVIGDAEARAIAAKMEHVALPRPMTHDLFASFAHAFGIAMVEVFIYKFEDGIFYSEVTFTDGERRVSFEARTSDAVAVAMRTGAPIYCTEEILHECGFVMQAEPTAPKEPEQPKEPTIEELERLRDEAVDAENYEEASRLTEIINQKKSI